MSFNSHSIADENRVGYNVAVDICTVKINGMRTNGHGKTRLASFIFEMLLATNIHTIFLIIY